jgi:hypothetical protein
MVLINLFAAAPEVCPKPLSNFENKFVLIKRLKRRRSLREKRGDVEEGDQGKEQAEGNLREGNRLSERGSRRKLVGKRRLRKREMRGDLRKRLRKRSGRGKFKENE